MENDLNKSCDVNCGELGEVKKVFIGNIVDGEFKGVQVPFLNKSTEPPICNPDGTITVFVDRTVTIKW